MKTCIFLNIYYIRDGLTCLYQQNTVIYCTDRNSTTLTLKGMNK